MQTIFKSMEGERLFHEAYNRLISAWPVSYAATDVTTSFGVTHILVSGKEDAPPLLLLHGMTFNSTMWRDNIRELSEHFRTFSIDVPGDFGKSLVARPLQSETDCAQWLCELMDSLGLSKAHVLGHSMGGWLALNFSLHAPERVGRLILIAPAGAFFRIPLKFILKVYPALAWPTTSRIRRAWIWFLARGSKVDEPVMRQIEAAWTHCRILLKVIPKQFEASRLRRLQPHTLFLVGEEEVIYSSLRAVQRVQKLLPSVETEVIPHASHCLNAEQPELVNDRILRFLLEDAI